MFRILLMSELTYFSRVGVVFYELGRYYKAINCFLKSNESNLENIPDYTKYNTYYLASAYLNLGDQLNTVKYLNEYLLYDPKNNEVKSLIGWCYCLLDEFDLAENIYKQLIEQDINSVFYRIDYSLILFQLNRKEEALKQLVISERSTDEQILKKLICSHKNRVAGNISDAITELEEVVSDMGSLKGIHYPHLEDIFIHLSGYYGENNNPENSFLTLEKADKTFPGDCAIMNALSFVYAEQGSEMEVAIKLINECLKIQPENHCYLDTKGWVLFKLNKIEQAKKYIIKSLEKAPNYRVAKEHLRIIEDQRNRTEN